MTGQSESETDSIELKGTQNSVNNKYEAKNDLHYVCTYDKCNAMFKRLYRLKRHERQHSGQRPFICRVDGCERSFTCKTYLNKHMKRPHNNNHNNDNKQKTKPQEKAHKQYNCVECEKVFKTKFQLRIHSYVHSGQKPFNCDKCDKQFVTQSKLKSHLKTHEGYACGRDGCDFVASKWTQLRKHIAVVHKACHECDLCNKKFNNNYNLNLHKEIIHSETKHKILCTFEGCDRSYARKSSLMTHIRSAHNGEQHKCTQEGCDKVFSYKKSLIQHLDNHLKPKPVNTKNSDKIFRRKASKASQLTGVQLSEDQIKEMMTQDIEFRNECIDKQINL